VLEINGSSRIVLTSGTSTTLDGVNTLKIWVIGGGGGGAGVTAVDGTAGCGGGAGGVAYRTWTRGA
jgi:hypothetical protein